MRILLSFAGRIRILDWFLMIQAATVALLLWFFNRLEVADFSLGGDAPSYLLFPFSPISEALSSHRTFGLPIILKAFGVFDDSFGLWPSFQLLAYISSVFFLYWCLIRVGFARVVAFATATGLLWNPGVLGRLQHIATEVFTATFLVLTISLVLLVASSKNRVVMALLGMSVFFLYQIRPNMSFVVLLIPIWGFAIARVMAKNPGKEALVVSFILLNICVWPLLAFGGLRYIVVRDFGLASFSGTVLSGQATGYLNDQNIIGLHGAVRQLADDIFWRKTRLSAPCNQFGDLAQRDRHECGNTYIMISWLAAIQQTQEIEPFDEPEKNIQPWTYRNLSSFFSINNVEVDSLLEKYSIGVIVQEKKAFLSRYVYELIQAVQFYYQLFFGHLFYVFAVVLLMVSFGGTKLTLATKGSAMVDHNQLMKRNKELLVLALIASSTIIFGTLTTGIIVHFDSRYLLTFGVLLLSTILVFALPPPFVRGGWTKE